MAVALIAGRDGYVVPLLAGDVSDVGEYWVLDAFWTPAVNAAAAVQGVASAVLGAVAARVRP
ncbi:MAG: hypothetical protein H6719_08850 [Sandaracinaceae bacterium]|nr:hypothetical protein [Sandaracinaceae bacterium]